MRAVVQFKHNCCHLRVGCGVATDAHLSEGCLMSEDSVRGRRSQTDQVTQLQRGRTGLPIWGPAWEAGVFATSPGAAFVQGPIGPLI